MEKVFNAFATRRGVAVGSLRFLLDGEKIGIDQTPKMLELEDQDQIDCMLEQVRLLAVGSLSCLLVYFFVFHFLTSSRIAHVSFRNRTDWWILIYFRG
jgi:Ubiquitin-2 like Rad60 SUMO-like